METDYAVVNKRKCINFQDNWVFKGNVFDITRAKTSDYAALSEWSLAT